MLVELLPLLPLLDLLPELPEPLPPPVLVRVVPDTGHTGKLAHRKFTVMLDSSVSPKTRITLLVMVPRVVIEHSVEYYSFVNQLVTLTNIFHLIDS